MSKTREALLSPSILKDLLFGRGLVIPTASVPVSTPLGTPVPIDTQVSPATSDDSATPVELKEVVDTTSIPPTLQDPSLSPKEVFEKTASAVVAIELKSDKRHTIENGTGFFLGEEGLVITNAHVVTGSGATHVVLKTMNHEERTISSVEDIVKWTSFFGPRGAIS